MSSPYPSLQTADLPFPKIWDIKPSSEFQNALEARFKPFQTTHPGMLHFAKSTKHSSFLRFDHKWHLDKFYDQVPQRSGPFSGRIRAFEDGNSTDELMDISGFCKITHLLDAYKVIQGEYPMSQHPGLPAPGKQSAKVFGKIHDPSNQAYVDAVACYMLSKFREAGHSPHFSLFYGAYLAIANEYYYNITEDFSDLRFESWFWKNQNQSLFSLVGFEGARQLESSDVLLETPDDLSSGSFSESDLSEIQSPVNADLESLESVSIPTASEHSSSDYSDMSADLQKNHAFFAVLPQFPTMLMFLESSQETMDSLMEHGCPNMEVSHGSQEWEDHWAAWLFQVIAALCQIQSLWAMTHNDLHSNNILWNKTDKKFLYYKGRDGRVWKVPTYGKIFRIIDFGRAIYTHNNVLCISDDYLPDNEAGSQYNFGPIYDPAVERFYPNPSFDLCRLSVSIFEGLFQHIPEDKDDGGILSSEEDRVQRETVSPLFNLLWSWLIDEDGRNVLWNSDQSERYPGFDLYCVIAQKVKVAVPKDQLDNALFSGFVFSEQIPDNEPVYSLFC
jgi:hypothetical protein